MIEVREVLRCWLDGDGLRTVAERAGVDRKTVRRYVEAAQKAGLQRSAGFEAVDDELVAAVVSAVRTERPNGHGVALDPDPGPLSGRGSVVADAVEVIGMGAAAAVRRFEA